MAEMTEMAELLAGLQKMKDTDPEVFRKAMESLGLGASPEGTPAADVNEEDSLLKMADAIKQMRIDQPNGPPGMDGVHMSKDAPKQVRRCYIHSTLVC
jgi:hypothetical protein